MEAEVPFCWNHNQPKSSSATIPSGLQKIFQDWYITSLSFLLPQETQHTTPSVKGNVAIFHEPNYDNFADSELIWKVPLALLKKDAGGGIWESIPHTFNSGPIPQGCNCGLTFPKEQNAFERNVLATAQLLLSAPAHTPVFLWSSNDLCTSFQRVPSLHPLMFELCSHSERSCCAEWWTVADNLFASRSQIGCFRNTLSRQNRDVLRTNPRYLPKRDDQRDTMRPIAPDSSPTQL